MVAVAFAKPIGLKLADVWKVNGLASFSMRRSTVLTLVH
jgi:hypothetical protein